jgi:broad specificity phosphatase PhoE
MMKMASARVRTTINHRRAFRCRGCLWILFGCLAAGCSQSQRTEVLLVRHAEKAAEPGNHDPSLTQAGVARAHALAERLRDTPVKAVYSTPWKRNRQTATVVAQVKEIPLHIEDRPAAELARHILEADAGATVLVVGHSNTIPEWIRALGCPEEVVIADQDYDDLFRVTVDQDGTAALARETYGKLTPVE